MATVQCTDCGGSGWRGHGMGGDTCGKCNGKGNIIMRSVLQDWVMELPIRAQGTLMTATRGCDIAHKNPKESSVDRELHAFLRFCMFHPADAREIDTFNGWFRSQPPASGWKPSLFGHYPEHWYSHVMHAYEVVGYLHPDPKIAGMAFTVYAKFVKNLHLNLETKEQMLERLTEDRIANDTVVS